MAPELTNMQTDKSNSKPTLKGVCQRSTAANWNQLRELPIARVRTIWANKVRLHYNPKYKISTCKSILIQIDMNK